jgi:hypothetical protein
MSLVDIFVNVLYGLYGKDRLQINVAAIAEKEIWRVWDDPAIVDLFASDSVLPAIIFPPVGSIRILSNGGGLVELLWEAL